MDKSTKKLQIGLWSIVAALVVGLCCMWYYQAHHFNKNVTINGISVGKMTAKDAADHLKNVTLDNTVYVGKDVMYRGQKTSAGFSSKDDGKIEAILKKQFTFVPSSVQKNYEVAPSNVSDYRKKELKKKVKDALTKANLKRKAAIDAYAVMKDGKVSVVPAEKGTQYDVSKIMKEYDKHLADSTLHLKERILQPLEASSKVVQAEKQKLDSLAKKETTYNVQGKTYEMKAAELLNSARVINGRYSYDDTGLRNKIDEINAAQATLNKPLSFKTTGGSTVSVPAGTYGWEIGKDDAVDSIETAWQNGTKEINAEKDIYGKGYYTYGTGYATTQNGGIGGTYAEVSISEQKVWLYRNGQQVYSADCVTGKQSTDEGTPCGVWYVMYKQSPSVLKGSESGKENYEVKVKYWAQFTNSGCGFHDASWRNNWDKKAYINDGSGGCVNLKADQAAQIYNLLEVKEPVIVY